MSEKKEVSSRLFNIKMTPTFYKEISDYCDSINVPMGTFVKYVVAKEIKKNKEAKKSASNIPQSFDHIVRGEGNSIDSLRVVNREQNSKTII